MSQREARVGVSSLITRVGPPRQSRGSGKTSGIERLHSIRRSMQLEEQGDVRADRAKGYNYFDKISQPSKIVLIIRVSQRITSIRNNESKTMKIISTHTATNANKTVTTMWKSNGGHSWYIGVLGTSVNKIWNVGSEKHIRGIWNREYKS